jgi:site-specific DNA recombinase
MEGKTTPPVRAALYARVSSEQQAQQCTIQSQVEAIKERICADGLTLEDELCFIDDGYTGSTLMRPALERLRDIAWAGGFQRLYVHSPDRLARRYAWQVLLVEELQRYGVELTFLNRTIGASPEEDLLLQMQGMIAEYERAKIMERSRRGKRHAARRGDVSVLGTAPYGYRFVGKHAGGGAAHYQVVFEEAHVVRQIFEWAAHERLSYNTICKRLKDQGIPSPKGLPRWHREVVGKLLKNPTYKGTAIFGKTRVGERVPRLRPLRGKPEQPRHPTSRYPGIPQDQVVIPVPALVSEELFAAVAEQLAENDRRYRRYAEECPGYLLQGLVECGCCGRAYYGKGMLRFERTRANGMAIYPYYRCIGSDATRHGGAKVCRNKPIRLDRLDAAVWADVCTVLQNPQDLRLEFERRLQGAPEPNASVEQYQKQITQGQRGISRLIDAYESGLLERSEFEPRLRSGKERLARLEREATEARERASQRADLHHVLGQLEVFAQKVRTGLERADMNMRREIIRSLVKSIKVNENDIRIMYRISPRPFASGPSRGQIRQHCHRRVERRMRRLAAGGGPERLGRHCFDHLFGVHRRFRAGEDLRGRVDGAQLLPHAGGHPVRPLRRQCGGWKPDGL